MHADTSSSGRAQSSDATTEAAPLRQVAIVGGAALGLGAGFAPVYFGTLSVFLKPIATELGWGRAETSAAGVLSMLGLSVGAVLVGRLIDRFGPALVISTSVLVMSALMFVLARATSSPWLFGAFSFAIGVAGAATTPPGYLSVLALWFDRRLGLALGLAGVGMGVGTVAMPMIAQWLVSSYGWREAYGVLAGGAAALGAAACALLFVRSRGTTRELRSRGGDVAPVAGETATSAVRSSRFWLLATVVFVVAAASLGTSIHLVSLITDRGLTAAAAAQVAATAGVGVVLGRIVAGVLLDLYPAMRIAAVAFLMAGSGALMLAIGTSFGPIQIAACAFLIGFAMGAEGDFIPYFVRRYFGLTAFGSIYGLLFFVFGVGGVIGPIAFGVSFDRTGSYALPLWGAAIALCCAAIGILQLGPYRYESDAPAARASDAS